MFLCRYKSTHSLACMLWLVLSNSWATCLLFGWLGCKPCSCTAVIGTTRSGHASRTLHPASSSSLLLPPVRLLTVGSRVFLVAGPRVWNTLPEDVTSAPSLAFPVNILKPDFSDNLILILLSDLASLY